MAECISSGCSAQTIAAFFSGLACSSWMMENDFHISARTLDNPPTSWIGAVGSGIAVVPRGTPGALGLPTQHGYLGFFAGNRSDGMGWIRMAGLNERGLSCDEQHLDESVYEQASGNATKDLPTHLICEWAIMHFGSCSEVRVALQDMRIVRGVSPVGPDSGHHFTFRDSQGHSLVLEVVDGRQRLYDDLNDGGATGFGVVTNSPTFEWHLRNLRFLKEKMQFARPGVAVPGNWYADERFARIWMTKSVMKLPGTTQEAVAQALAVMQTVAVPQGLQMGTDSAPGDGGDYTIWGAVYDHRQPCLYWHSARNPLLRRLCLKDLGLEASHPVRFVELKEEAAWFSDARAELEPWSLEVV